MTANTQAYHSHLELAGRITSGPLTSQLQALRPHDHLCSFYDSAEEQLPVVVSFFKEGLARGHACLYVADDRTKDEIVDALSRAGVSTSAATALHFVSRDGWRNPGPFAIPDMARGVRHLTEGILQPGFGGLWIAVDMTWALEPDVRPDELAAWESHWNTLIQEVPVTLLCQYNRRRVPAETVHLQLHTHPMVVLGGGVYTNFFYEPPEIYLDKVAHERRAQWMLDQVRLAAEAERHRENSLRSEVLLKEVHHRVKNNLQVVASLLSLQTNRLKDPEARLALQDSVGRVRALSILHSRLTLAGGAPLNFGEHLRDVLSYVASSRPIDGTTVEVEVVADDVALDLDTAVPCSLIVNELATNAFKHAFRGRGRGRIEVRLAKSDKRVSLAFKDDGVGMAWSDTEASRSPSLGLTLVESLTQQIGGELSVNARPGMGTVFALTFPVNTAA